MAIRLIEYSYCVSKLPIYEYTCTKMIGSRGVCIPFDEYLKNEQKKKNRTRDRHQAVIPYETK